MRVFVAKTNNKTFVTDIDGQDFRAIQKIVDGPFEIAPTREHFPSHILMLVNDEGIILNLPTNAIATVFGTNMENFGIPILGDVVFVGINREISELESLTDEDILFLERTSSFFVQK